MTEDNPTQHRKRPARGSTKRIRKANRGWAFLALTGSLILANTNANADTYTRSSNASYYVSAPVVSVSPITTERTVSQPIRQCTTETYYDEGRHEHRHRRENLFLPGLIGGIVGSLIGNQFGGGSGKKALTIAGAMAGSSIARDAARQNRRQQAPQETCRTSYERSVVEEISAYDVTYEYAGQLFSKRMDRDPGNSVQVRVALEPNAGDS